VTSPAAARDWLRRRGPVTLLCAGAGAVVAGSGSAAPGRDLEALTRALSASAGGAHVAARDVRWAPSGGPLEDVVLGRWVLFLARRDGEDTRDVWRARARTTPEGAVLDVADAVDLTNTPLGDDHELVVRGQHAAFTTRAYGQEQSVIALDLAGEGARNRAAKAADRAMAAVTNLQQTGGIDGVGRVEVTLEAPPQAWASPWATTRST
jgi:hypothetical protein